MNRKQSFSARLSLSVLVITSVLFIIAMAVIAISSHMLIAEEATKSSERLLDATISDIEKTLQMVESSVRSSAWMVEENRDERDIHYHICSKIVEENDNIIGSAVAFVPNYFPDLYYFSPYSWEEDGTVRTKQLGNPKYDYFCMDWFQIPYLTGEPCWSEPYFDEGGSDILMSTYSYPVKDENGDIYAILTADLTLNWISDMAAEIKPYPNSNVTLFSRAGAYINRISDSRLSGETIFSTLYLNKDHNVSLENLARAIMNNEKGVMKYAVGQRVSFAVFGPLSNGWKASITCNYEDVLARTSKMHLVLLLVGLLGLLILFLTSYFAVRKLTKPLLDISTSAISIAGGNFNTELPQIHTDDEIRRLRDSFDYMQHSLVDYIRNLQTTTAEKERYENELGIARKIQMAMLPHDFPKREDLSLMAALRPAKEVGGDLYDFKINGDRLYFLIGDVSGKGIPASLVMSITKQAFRLLGDMELDVAQLVSKVNNCISDGNETGMFVTLFLGVLDLKTGDLDYCNAGHNPAIIISPAGNPEYMKPKPNLALGVFGGFPYEMQHTVLEKGSRLLLYTDGVTEAERGDKEQFGESRLLDWTNGSERFTDAADACGDLLATIDGFVEGNEQNDDITIMTINYFS